MVAALWSSRAAILPTGTFEMKENADFCTSRAWDYPGQAQREDDQRCQSIPTGNGNVVRILVAGARNFTIEVPEPSMARVRISIPAAATAWDWESRRTPPDRDRQCGPAHLMVFSRRENFRVENIFLTRSAITPCAFRIAKT